jgi:hypothetical protein
MFGGSTMSRAAKACVVSLVALLTVVGVASARSRGTSVSVKLVEGQAVVQASSVATFSAQCPARAPHPVSGEFGSLAADANGQLALAASFPTGRRGWSLSVKNLGDQPRGFGAGVVCVSARARFAYPRASIVAQPQQANGIRLRCPRSAPSSIGSSFELQPGAAAGSALVNFMSQTYNKKGPDGGEDGGMRNLTDVPVGFLVGSVCSSLPIHPHQATGTVPPQKTDGFTFRCPRGQFAVSGSFFGPDASNSGAVVLDGSFAIGLRKWSIDVKNLASQPVPYVAGDVCVG